MLVHRIGGCLAAVFLVVGVSAAEAQTYYGSSSPTGKWFVDGNIGASWGDFDGFTVQGTGLTSSGSSDTALTAGVGIGLYFTNQIYARLSYRFLGSFSSSGTIAGIPASIDTDAHALLLGLGANFNLSNQVFVEATGEIGTAFLRSSGSQIAGIPTSTNTETNLAGGLGLGLGYHLTPSTDLLVMGNYYWLGDAQAGSSAGSITANDLTVVSATAGLRVKF